MAMQRWAGRVALVTGASSGIGAGLVKALVKHGMKVVGCGRDVGRIQLLAEELKKEVGSLTAIRCDLSKEDDIKSMFDQIKSDPDLGGVDVCINNAGLAHNDPLLTGCTDRWKEMMDVNVMGMCICTREAFKSMQERKVDDGHIIMMNSLSGHEVTPLSFLHFYSVTKFAVTAVLESIRQELRELKSGIRISSVSPGIVETEFAVRLNQSAEQARQLYSSLECLQPEDIANTVIYILQSPPHMQVTTNRVNEELRNVIGRQREITIQLPLDDALKKTVIILTDTGCETNESKDEWITMCGRG